MLWGSEEVGGVEITCEYLKCPIDHQYLYLVVLPE